MTTMMLVVVVGVFLLAELPNALLFITLIVDNTWELPPALRPSVTSRAKVVPAIVLNVEVGTWTTPGNFRS